MALTLAWSAAPIASQVQTRRELLVAAAASLSEVAPQLTRAFHDAAGVDLRFNFAGSNTLARQIVEGARVDVFFSADARQMDVVERAGRVVPGTRADILSNQLVLIVPVGNGPVVAGPSDLASHAVRRVAMGDPEAVPAGVYGREWLQTINLWGKVQSKIVPLSSSPGALAAVREGRAQAGIVYATDAQGQHGVRVVHTAAAEDAPEIVYPAAAITEGRHGSARAFLEFLRSDTARRIFEGAGFRSLGLR